MVSESESSDDQRTEKIPVWDLPDVPKGELPPHIQLQRTRVLCTFDAPTHVNSLLFISSLVNFFFLLLSVVA